MWRTYWRSSVWNGVRTRCWSSRAMPILRLSLCALRSSRSGANAAGAGHVSRRHGKERRGRTFLEEDEAENLDDAVRDARGPKLDARR